MTSVPEDENSDSSHRGRHRVVIIGAGFGGLFAAKFLRKADVDVTIIDRTNHHVFQPLLYQVATGILSPGKIAPATREILKRHQNVAVQLGNVTDIDLQTRTVTAVGPDGQELVRVYDSLIVAAGVGQSYFGHDEFAEYAPGMKTIEDALNHRERILTAFEQAEVAPSAELQREWLTFVVVGGGPTGVEIAGQVAELARRTLMGNYAAFEPDSTRVLLFEGGDRILATFGDHLSRNGTKELERTGVEIHTSSIVTNVDATGVIVKGPDGVETRYQARTVIWAAGVQASPLGKMVADAAGIETDRVGRVNVLPDCTVPGYPEVFVVGDLMALNGLPGVAEVAMQSGMHAAATIKRRTEGSADHRDFKYRDLGSMAAISRRRAIVSFHGVKVWGFLGWIAWLFVHIAFLTGFRNRFMTITSWAFTFLGRARIERAIVGRDLDMRQPENER
jgi:NADH dehydrogenase